MFAPTAPLGRAIRLPLRLIPRGAILPVLSGPNRGRRWIVRAGTHGCWLGRYERQEIGWFLTQLRPEDVVWDIGAHAGYFSLACASRCREVVACEALPANLANLRRHVTMNRLSNVRIVGAAIADSHGGAIAFGGSSSSYQNRIGAEGAPVPVESIDHLVATGHTPPSIVKMDVEGAESRVLQGAADTIARHRPRLLVAVHGEEQETACRSFFEERGYAVEMLNIATLWATPAGSPVADGMQP